MKNYKLLFIIIPLIAGLLIGCSPVDPVTDDVYIQTIYTYNGTAWNIVTSNWTPSTPALHASTHENGGSDEIDVTGLSGVLADNQTPDLTGILTFPDQPSMRAYDVGTFQYIPHSSWQKVILNTIGHDEQNEFNDLYYASTTTGTSAGKLIDSGASFDSSYLGARLYNRPDTTYSYVTAVDSPTQLSIFHNIMTSGEQYILYFSRYTATDAGKYMVAASIVYQTPTADKKFIVATYKNGTRISQFMTQSAYADQQQMTDIDILELDAGDYLEMWTFQYSGGIENLYSGIEQIYFTVHKVA